MLDTRHKLLAGAAAIVALGGGTLAAVTAADPAAKTASHHRSTGALGTAAGYLGVSRAQLRAELNAGKSLAEIANATSGRSAAGLIEALVTARKAQLATAAAELPKHVAAEVQRTGGPGAGGPTRARHPGQASVVARYLGLGRSQLWAELRSGKSLGQIAASTPGKSEAGLIEALVAARTARIQARVASGKITQSQANQRLAHLSSRVKSQVDRPRGKGGAGAAARPTRG